MPMFSSEIFAVKCFTEFNKTWAHCLNYNYRGASKYSANVPENSWLSENHVSNSTLYRSHNAEVQSRVFLWLKNIW